MYIVKNVSGNPAYAEEIHNLDFQCFPDDFWSLQLIQKELSDTRAIYLVCLFENRVVGYINANSVLDEAELNRVAVCEQYRRSGIATLLMDELTKLVQLKGCVRINLEVRKSNFAARKLYSGYGYIENTIRPNYYQNPVDDAVLMSFDF